MSGKRLIARGFGFSVGRKYVPTHGLMPHTPPEAPGCPYRPPWQPVTADQDSLRPDSGPDAFGGRLGESETGDIRPGGADTRNIRLAESVLSPGRASANAATGGTRATGADILPSRASAGTATGGTRSANTDALPGRENAADAEDKRVTDGSTYPERRTECQ
jgi:hypothetical protein